MLTLFLVFIITKGALTLYEGNTIGRGAVRGGDTAQGILLYNYYINNWILDFFWDDETTVFFLGPI